MVPYVSEKSPWHETHGNWCQGWPPGWPLARILPVDGNQLCEIGPHLLATLGCMGLEVQCIVRRRHLALEVQRIMPKAIHMGGEVRAQPGQDGLVHGISLLD